jgi:indolepyruvate ferredoxin oxidoreductase beta subunit
MSSWLDGQRPLTLAIMALGGEGGGVLADWVVAAAEGAGYYAQNTSVAGVAQRTGATVYYVELFPPRPATGTPTGAAPVRSEPVMSIFPTPGEVDIVIASELMECGRAIQRGFATPDRTTLITSTNRVYSINEKIAPGDGRVDDRELLAAAQRSSERLIAADFAQIAERSNSVISASLFGALAGSGALPLTRAQFEAPIRAFGKASESSLAAFSDGFAAASAPAPASPAPSPPQTPAVTLPISEWGGPSEATDARKSSEEERRNQIAADHPEALVGPALRPLAQRTLAMPAVARSMILHGLVRTAVYQDLAYAERYLDRVSRFAAVDAGPDGRGHLTLEAGRHIALWMCYQDTIQVAQQKTRRARMVRVRTEAKARPDQRLDVREFLHPRIDEITDTLPAALGERLRNSPLFNRVVGRITERGMILNTTSLFGYTLLTVMASARPLRPRSLRFGRESEAIESWLSQALAVAAKDPELAREIIQCQGLLKGYGATWEHGSESFQKLMAAARALNGSTDAAAKLAALRAAAGSDEDGSALEAELARLRSSVGDERQHS